jgi:LPXTG-motif cell wall-anchored protein
MPGWRRPAAVAAVMLTLLPAAAAAQSAGDEQYEDPFAGEQPTPTSTPAPAPSLGSGTAPSAAPSAAPAPAATASAQLPRTGADLPLAILAGAFLLASGAALRLRLQAHGRRRG